MAIKGIKSLLANLGKRQRQAAKDDGVTIIVGYNANYALFVHEAVDMKLRGQKRTGTRADGSKRKGRYWDPQGRGQAKFLERPARENAKEIAAAVVQTVKNGGTLTQGLVIGGLLLQRISQKLVPVDLGNLKGSAFTEKE